MRPEILINGTPRFIWAISRSIVTATRWENVQ